jgi:hypothetical protein
MAGLLEATAERHRSTTGRRPKCYLAGPMRGIPNWNGAAFAEATNNLRLAGWDVFSPHEKDRELGIVPPADGQTDKPLTAFPIGDDLKAIAEGDAVFVLPGWEASEGATLEVDVAYRLKRPVYEYRTGEGVYPYLVDFEITTKFERRDVLPDSSAERKSIPLTTGVIDYFPAALIEVAKVSKAGNDKHNPGEPMHHARGKSTDHADSIARHLVDRGGIDADTGQRHTAELAWRALALLQQELEDAGAPLARGARLPE